MARPSSRRPFAPALAITLGAVFASFGLAACARDAASPSTRTLPSGLRIEELRAGGGAEAGDGDWVEVQYAARVVAPDATVGDPARAAAAAAREPVAPFDATRSGEPFVFRIGRSKVLAAFAEGVTGMREGGRRQLTLPPALAYGALGKGPVPPDATLEYDVELVRRFTRSNSGVDFIERKHGTGPKPKSGQSVVLLCREWLVETGRSILDAKRTRNGLIVELGAGQAIPALEKILPEMNVGSLWRLGVPPELGYGSAGHLPLLVTGQDLVLDVELVAIKDQR